MGKPIKELEAASMTSKSCTISMNTCIPQLETNSFPVAVYVPQQKMKCKYFDQMQIFDYNNFNKIIFQ